MYIPGVACYLVLCTGDSKLSKNVSGSQILVLCLGLTSLWKELVNYLEDLEGKILGVSLSYWLFCEVELIIAPPLKYLTTLGLERHTYLRLSDDYGARFLFNI